MPICGRNLLEARRGINDFDVVEGGENGAKQLNLTVPACCFFCRRNFFAEISFLSTNSRTGTPTSACFSTPTICSTANLFLFTANTPFFSSSFRRIYSLSNWS